MWILSVCLASYSFPYNLSYQFLICHLRGQVFLNSAAARDRPRGEIRTIHSPILYLRPKFSFRCRVDRAIGCGIPEGELKTVLNRLDSTNIGLGEILAKWRACRKFTKFRNHDTSRKERYS